jgi:hypothetical protein
MRGVFKTAVIALLLLVGSAPAQPSSAATRAQRLKEHERKIKEIIDRRRDEQKRAEEANLAGAAAAAAPTPAPAEAPAEPPKPVSSVVMGFKFTNDDGESDYNIIVRSGDTFLTEVYLFNIDQNPIDRVRLALDFDKRFITPLRVFDAEIRPQIEGGPTFEVDEREAVLNYDARFARPVSDAEIVVLRILWRALRSTPYSGIHFAFDPLEREGTAHTAVFADGRNILGTESDSMDGVLSGGLMIDLPTGETPVLQGKAEELKTLYLGSVASEAEVGLQLVGPNVPVKVGDVFRVRLQLNNPEGALIDAMNFFLKFDETTLEVVDVDRFNWITRGVNVHDGPYHRNFPWDMMKRNEVRNDRGHVNYQKSLSNGAALPSKTFADVYFRAKAPTTKSEMFFIQGKLSDTANSSVRYFGYERLNLQSKLSEPNFAIEIHPAPEEVAQAAPPEESLAPVVDPGLPQVRQLRIERD